MFREFHVAPISLQAARPALVVYHYLRSVPGGVARCYGCWEGGQYLGAIVFGYDVGSRVSNQLGTMNDREIMVLLRVALSGQQKSQTSRFVAEALRQLFAEFPPLKYVIAHADASQGHVGALYQALNAVYVGPSETRYSVIKGKPYHTRTLYDVYGTNSPRKLANILGVEVTEVKPKNKLKYILPRDKKARKAIEHLALPYPKKNQLDAITKDVRVVSASPMRAPSAP